MLLLLEILKNVSLDERKWDSKSKIRSRGRHLVPRPKPKT